MDHADRLQIVLHEVRGTQVQNVQTADRVQLLFRRMQSRDWLGAFWNLRAVAAQMHRVANAGFLHRSCDRSALLLLVLPGFRRRQHQVCRVGTAESFAKRCRIAQIGRKCFRAFVHKSVVVAVGHAPRRAPSRPSVTDGDDRAGIPARPQNHIPAIRNNG